MEMPFFMLFAFYQVEAYDRASILEFKRRGQRPTLGRVRILGWLCGVTFNILEFVSSGRNRQCGPESS